MKPELFASAGQTFAFGRKPFRVDILTAPSGVEFEECYARRIEAVLDDVKVSIISLDDLKTNKLASNRTKDRADLENLPPTSIV